MQLSPLQRRLWWINESSLNAPGFNIAVLLQTQDTVTAEWIAAIEARCLALELGKYQLNYGADQLAWETSGEPAIQVQQHDARQPSAHHPDGLQRAEQLAQHHFDLTREAPVKLHVIYDDASTYFLLVCCHIVFDGSSAGLLLASLAQQPRAMAKFGLDNPALYPPAEAHLASEASLHIWQKRLADAPEGLLNLLPAPSDVAVLTMSDELLMALRQHCREQQVRLSVWMMTEWAKWLQTRCGQSPLSLGTVYENRHSPQSKLALGLHVSIVPLVIHQPSVDDIHQQLHALRTFPFAPYEQLAASPEFSAVDMWFDSFFGFHHWPKQQIELQGQHWNICVFAQNMARYPIALDVFRLGKTVQLKIEKSAQLEGLTSQQVGESYLQCLIDSLPSSLSHFSASHRSPPQTDIS